MMYRTLDGRPIVGTMSPQTLTFLFTDIEGSTPLWDTRPAAMRAATERHNAILREAIAAHGGNAFRVVGDAFCIAFTQAASAVAAAIDAQRRLSAQPWGEAPIHVRMGVHSGAVEPTEDEIFRGPSLARAARVMSAAHGDQILATAASVALLEGELPPSATLRDLGDHTLRGFARPERLYQVTVAGLRAGFPPIRTQEALRTNLPPALTPFIGRVQALADVREAVLKSRLATLIGPGGTGKTRLAIEAASELVDAFEGGVWLVELASVGDPALVAMAVAAALGSRAEGDVSPLALIESALAGKRALIIADNCEHLIEEVARIAHALLRTLPHLHLLATSREALGVDGETAYRVPSMIMPAAESTGSDVRASEAGALFAQRAAAVAPAFAITDRNARAIARICRRLDGIPLAIELAASRLTALSVEELARRVDDRFRLLTGGLRSALPRQRTLRALVDWSYDLLSPDERRVLDRLAVFSGGFSLDAAEALFEEDQLPEMTVLDSIERLVAKSLVIAEQQRETETRYRLLETIRQYAGEKLLDSGEADSSRRRHYAFFLGLAEHAAAALNGPLVLEWLDRIEIEHDNIRAALDWSADVSSADYARLAGAMAGFWDTRGYFSEGWARLERAITTHAALDPSRLVALVGAGRMASRLDYTQRSDDILCEAIRLAQALCNARLEAQATIDLAINRMLGGVEALESLGLRAQALARSAEDAPLEAFAVFILGRAAVLRSNFVDAQRIFLDSARRWERAGCVLRVPLALGFAGGCALEQLGFAEAHRLLDAALIQHRRMGNVHDAAMTLRSLGEVALKERRLLEACMHCTESLRMFHALHDPNCGVRAAAALVRVHTALEDIDAARNVLAEALEVQLPLERSRGLPSLLEAAAALRPDAADAPVLLASAATMRAQWGVAVSPTEREEYERCHAEVRARHGEEALERATGHALERNAAIVCALAVVRG